MTVPPAGLQRPRLLTDVAVPERTVTGIAARFAETFSEQMIYRDVFESCTAPRRTATVTTHLTGLTRRFATDRLTALAHAEGALVSDVPEVLFVCVHNAGRSQMAAALLDHHAEGRVHVRSAGSAPADQINPAVREVMAEIGLDLSREFPKPLTDDVVRAADVVISMGCGDACPVYPGKRYLDWELTDPAGKTAEEVRPIRDDIDARVRALLAELTAPTPADNSTS
ncbi:protein-tyrosine-phosphatase [Pseudonocardia hierapolitana]|uniref:Protein-tyrosine-phosphatase n=1 Tax=Pseudonocardia hierapolitana TaxID=1128676 RepID=A0A561SZR1_9PSEU|nr:protein-tyrosine-phosphatase [Pseudonocardia hierapolitana]